MVERLLSARGLSRRFGRRVALQPIDLDLAGGEVLALGGPNGAGKSTLLALLAGALPPSAGTVTGPAAARLGWMPQQPAVYRLLTPRENLELFARLAGIDAAAAAERALAAVGLETEERRAAELSVGNLQRLNLGVALLGDPRVLLLDEPTASLDRSQRVRLWRLVEAVRAEGGAVVFATHSLDEARRAAGRLLVLEEGRVVYAGAPAAFAEDAV